MTSINDFSSVLNSYYNNLNSKNSNSTSDSSTESTKNDYSNKTALGRYVSSVSPDKADAKTIFTKLSIDLDGDGKTITKNQLDSYVDDAKNKKISIPDEEMSGLKELQDNWDTIADGGDSISYSGISKAGHKDALLSMVPDNSNTIDMSHDAADFKKKINSYLIESALNTSSDSLSKSDYSSMLKTLLSGTTDENDDANADLIGKLTNIMASYQSNSTIEEEA